MRVARFFVDRPLEAGTTLELPTGPARHLTRVLRLDPGAPILLFNGDGHDYQAQCIDVGPAVRVVVDRRGAEEPTPPMEIHLAIGISKGERMDYALQKSVELGVHRITPLFTERSQVALSGDRLQRRDQHWRGVLIAACEQSGRRRLVGLERAETYGAWIRTRVEGGLLLAPDGPHALAALAPPGPRITLLIGPEGGLSQGERARALNAGFAAVRLGPRILRTETAPLAAIAVIQALWGDYRD